MTSGGCGEARAGARGTPLTNAGRHERLALERLAARLVGRAQTPGTMGRNKSGRPLGPSRAPNWTHSSSAAVKGELIQACASISSARSSAVRMAAAEA